METVDRNGADIHDNFFDRILVLANAAAKTNLQPQPQPPQPSLFCYQM
jgi:hypothetical protein